MRRQARQNTRPELALRRELTRRSLRYRLQVRVPGTRRRADVAFIGAKVAVFVDGCFWHSCPQHGTSPKANARWWAEKLATNKARDADTDQRLAANGWLVMRVWEHEAPTAAAARIDRAVARRRPRAAITRS
jgi:DNA mismatch endonuclease (patch repair protein)